VAVAAVSLTSARTVKWREGFGGLMFRVGGRMNLGWRVGCGGKGERERPLQRRREAMDEVSFRTDNQRKFGICFLPYLWVSCVVCSQRALSFSKIIIFHFLKS